MKRALVAVAAAAALVVPACTTSNQPPIVLPPQAFVSPAAVSTGVSVDAREPVVAVVKRVLPAVVNVVTDQLQTNGLGGSQQGRGVGTGFIVSPDGYIVTNYHVVEAAQRIRVITSGPNPQQFDARVVGGDVIADVAVLKVDAQNLPTQAIGRSSDLQLGQRVVAIGYALALEGGPTVTTGIVSSLSRTIEAQDPNCQICNPAGVRKYSDVIQTDAAINPGNSGGPLVNLAGQVVGIDSAGAGQAENIGFAIPIDSVWPIIQNAIQNPEAPIAYLGVVTQTIDDALALQLGLPTKTGVFVVGLSPNGPAERAGLREGDVIVSFDGQQVSSSEQLGELIRSHVPDDQVQLTVTGPGGERTLTATLGINPDPTT